MELPTKDAFENQRSNSKESCGSPKHAEAGLRGWEETEEIRHEAAKEMRQNQEVYSPQVQMKNMCQKGACVTTGTQISMPVQLLGTWC